jgi:hypothetical protein
MTKIVAIKKEVMIVVVGSVDIGVIDAEAAAAAKITAAAIRLPEGVPGPNGYGLLHVESNERRMKAIRGLQFAGAEAFIHDIAQNWVAIVAGENGRLVLVREIPGYGLRAVVGFTEHNGVPCWSVVTALPARRIGPNETVLFRKKTVG